MTRPADSDIWEGFERRLREVEALVPERPPRWIGPAEAGSVPRLRSVTDSRPAVRTRIDGDRWLLVIAAVVVVAIGVVRLVAVPTTEPGGQPTTSPSGPLRSSPSPGASLQASPAGTIRPIGIAFKEVPSWLVPADGVAGPGSSSEDGTWSQQYDVPRSPVDVVDDYRSRLASEGIDIQRTGTAIRVVLSTRGVAPAIVVVVIPKGSGSSLDISFDRHGS